MRDTAAELPPPAPPVVAGPSAPNAQVTSAAPAAVGGDMETLTAGQGVPQTAPVAAGFFTSPSEIRDELAVHEILPRLYAGAQVEGQTNYEKQDSAKTDTYWDSVTGALRWVPFYGLNIAYEGSYDLNDLNQKWSVDELTATLGGVNGEPWYIGVGKTSQPFGEFNSHFREDPVTAFLGESVGYQAAGGYESDRFELTFAARKGDSGSQSYSWFTNLTFSPIQDVDAGVFYSSDLTKSTEINVLIKDAQDLNPGTLTDYSPVHGVGTFMSLQKYNYSIDFEYIAALDRFDTGLIADDSPKPWAWNFEATYRPFFKWELGVRLEKSSSVPDQPETQYGVETTYGFGPHLAVSLEYLRGSFADAPDRDLVTAGLVLRW